MALAAVRASKPRLRLPDAFEFLFSPPLGSVRYRVAQGGRGGAKSGSVARALLAHGMERPLRILCTREYQSSIRESVHYLLESIIYEYGLSDFYTVEKQRIYGHGTEFIFMGLHHDPNKIKSLEAVDLCWVEEAQAITKASWDVLVPTIRAEGSEIWVTFNPGLPDDHIYKLFVADPDSPSPVPPPNAIVRKVGWEDNPFLSSTLRAEQEQLLERDPEGHAHIWGGEPWLRSDAQIFAGKYRVAEFEPGEDWGPPLYGADWGFAQDPSVLLRCHVADSRVWVEYDERGIGWTMDETARRFRRVPGIPPQAERPDDAPGDWTPPIRGPVILADSARPETIREIRDRGLNVRAVKKWPGSVEDGIEHLRSYEEIVIHPRCAGMIQEMRLYRYKVDKRTGLVLPKIVDAHNHGVDSLRYALAPLIRKRPKRKIGAV